MTITAPLPIEIKAQQILLGQQKGYAWQFLSDKERFANPGLGQFRDSSYVMLTKNDVELFKAIEAQLTGFKSQSGIKAVSQWKGDDERLVVRNDVLESYRTSQARQHS